MRHAKWGGNLIQQASLNIDLKRQSDEIFLLPFFSLNGLSWSQWTCLKAILKFSNFRGVIFTKNIKKSTPAVNDSGDSKIEP
jgi:hypothetical protein